MTNGPPFPLLPLAGGSLDELAARGLAVPHYDRQRLRPRIAHIGVGGFHRAHLAVYCHRLAQAGSTWGIRGLGVLPADLAMAEALGPQECLYTFSTKGGGEPVSEVIGSIVNYRWVAGDWDSGVAALADPEVAIISLTVTEAGYEPPSDESGQAGSRGEGRTAFDLVAEALDHRRSRDLGPVTILSCDNLPGNGEVARQATLRATERREASLTMWVSQHCSFPSSMVDRITPVTADGDHQHLATRWGVVDRWPVVAEPFTQWVVEDQFVAGRPDFEAVGVLFSDDVHAWERYKLRLLNAGHSTIAYLSALAGITFVDQAMATPEIRAFLHRFLTAEAAPTVAQIPGHRREDYVATVLERFTNTGVRDQIARLCIDGSAKFPVFLLPTVTANLDRGGPVGLAALALAGWARYLATTPAGDLAFDASAATARRHAAAALDDPAAFLGYEQVFGPVANDRRFRAAFVDAYEQLRDRGVLAAVGSLVGEGR